MWFRNLQIFQLDQDWLLPPGTLEERLAKQPLRPCSAMGMSSAGWVPPDEDAALVHDHERHLLIALGTEDKLLPASIVNDLAKVKAVEFERSRGFKPGRKQMRDLKDQATAELLPRALARRRRTLAWVDPVAKRIIVDSASPGRAETLVEQLRSTLDELKVSLPVATVAPDAVMTAWLQAGAATGNFALGDACELAGKDESKPIVRYLRHPLEDAQLKRQLEQGFRATRLALVWNSRLSFVVDERLQLKRLAFLEMDEAADTPTAVPAAERLQAELALMTGELSGLLRDLYGAFSITSG